MLLKGVRSEQPVELQGHLGYRSDYVPTGPGFLNIYKVEFNQLLVNH
jgi:hypothetical protein